MRKEAIRKTVRGETERLRGLLQNAQTIAIVGHARPDGDAVGSTLALTLGIQRSGKEVVPVLADGVPNRFLFLPGAGRVVREIPAGIDLLIAVDCLEGLEFAELAGPEVFNVLLTSCPSSKRSESRLSKRLPRGGFFLSQIQSTECKHFDAIIPVREGINENQVLKIKPPSRCIERCSQELPRFR